MKKVSQLFPWLVLGCLALFVVSPLLTRGFIPTHDGEYHIIRFWQFEKMLRAGYLFPRWAPDLNSGYGVPLFNFHYPFPNYVGSLFHLLGWSFVDSFKLVLATGYLGAAIACLFWLKKLFDRTAATVGTIIFSFIPYWFVDIYVRGSVGEVLALGFVMIALASIEYGRQIVFSLAIAGLILSHNILAMLFVPILFGYMVLRRKPYWMALVRGILLPAYFWIPALAERGYVTGLTSINYRDHFPDLVQLLIPSWGTGFSGPGLVGGEMSFQIGVAALLLSVATLALVRQEKNRPIRLLILSTLGLFLLGVFLMLPLSDFVWRLLPVFTYLQYPWRLLSIFLPIVALWAGYVASRVKKTWVVMLFTVLAVVIATSYARPVRYEPRTDAHYLTRREFTDGTSSLGNSFSTIWAPWKSTRATEKAEVIEGSASVFVTSAKPLSYTLRVDGGLPSVVRVNILYYPGWTVRVNGTPIPIQFQNDGTITFQVPEGNSVVRVYFTETPLRRFADWLTVAGLFWIILSGILSLYAYRHRHISPRKRP